MDSDLIQVRERIIAAVRAKNRNEWDLTINTNYTAIMHFAYTYMFADILYTFMENELNPEVEFLEEAVRCTIHTHHMYQAVILSVILKIYTNHRVELVMHNKWLLKLYFGQSRLKSEIPNVSSYLLKFVISNNQCFKTSDIWANITILIENNLIEREEILRLCIDNDLPDIMENLVNVFRHRGNDNEFCNILEILLQRNIQPPYKLIRHIFRKFQIPMLELFDKYNIDIKQIVQSENETRPEYDQMEHFLNKFNMNLSDYASIMDPRTHSLQPLA
jgi:hypothetical protein